LKYRAEIDGLRAFAVLSVLAFHAFPAWLSGGFIGVDVFFVISGYLITHIIFEELDNGTFGFGDFYGRRVRRIFPALILVLAVSLGFGWYVLLVDEYAQLGKHIALGVAFVLNLFLVNEVGYFVNEAGYLVSLARTKPMWHLWSLAVEEQFYIIWPLILWLAWKRKFNLLTVTIAVAFISFALNLTFVTTKPAHTFCWPVGRFWELLSGSALAWLMLYKREMLSCSKLWIDRYLLRVIHPNEVTADGSTVNNVMSFLGLLMLVYGVMRINEGVSFPGTWALVPVVGTLLIIAAGSKAWSNQVFLMNPLAIFFGRISYPLYLWNWPILTFIFLRNGREVAPLEDRMLAVIGSILLAWLTFVVLEKPVRARRASGLLVIALFAVLSAVGMVGFSVWKGKLPSREGMLYPIVDEVALHVPTPEKDKVKCLARLGISDKVSIRYCSISSSDEPAVALIGGSHSGVLLHGLAYHLEREYGEQATVASRIINEVRGVSWVTYDISTKPPETIEWA